MFSNAQPVIVISPFSVIPSGLSDVGYADIQASTITCTDLADTDFGNTDIPTTETTTLTDGSSYKVCARAEDSNGNAIYASFAFTLDTTEPSTPTLDTPADKAVSGLSTSSDGITEKGDITITGCALENTDVYAQITADSITTQASTFTTANDTTTGCTDTDHDGYSLIISTSDLTSSRAGTENAITVSSLMTQDDRFLMTQEMNQENLQDLHLKLMTV